VYKEDEEAHTLWGNLIGIPADRIVPMGEKDNFWAMGETGPCGPCSEILIDQGPDIGCGREDCRVGCDCDRYLELWNLVFMQFNRDKNGALHPLPKPSIDTGMGLERITAVVHDVKNNYDTDLFLPLIRFIEATSQKSYGIKQEYDVSIRVIADHSRAIAFLIGDGILPSNEGRGYVLRRIIRRASRHGKMLGMEKPFLHETVRIVAEEMQEPYPEILGSQEYISRVVMHEEENFSATLDVGLRILQEEIQLLKQKKCNTIPGDVVFKLYDTYGFPFDLTADIAVEQAMGVDEGGFQKAMESQQRRARQHWKGSGDSGVSDIYKKLAQEGITTEFTGYDNTKIQSHVLKIIQDGKIVKKSSGDEVLDIVTPETCFYGEAGGQAGDVGIMTNTDLEIVVSNTIKPLPELIVHKCRITNGTIHEGDTIELLVNADAYPPLCFETGSRRSCQTGGISGCSCATPF
jgi:alanyl-tRNA synthetase